MNILKRTETPVIPAFIPAPKLTVTKTKLVNPNIIECPAVMFANKRIIKANGFVMVPTNSIICINGKGALRKVGTSGQNKSL